MSRHFAELDKVNTALRIVVVSDGDALSDLSGPSFAKALFGGNWVPVFKEYKRAVGKHYTYDKEKTKFIAPQPYLSRSLDKDDVWMAPALMPFVPTPMIFS